MDLSDLFMRQLEELNQQINVGQLEETHEQELIHRFNEKAQSVSGL